MAPDEQMEIVARQLGNIDETLERITGYLERIAIAVEVLSH